MTFRRLNSDELSALEKPFIKFLVANTITGDDWAKMKTQEAERAFKLVDIFSDFIFEERLKKVEFIQHQEPKELRLFKCTDDKMLLIGLQVDADSTIDFTQTNDLAKIGDLITHNETIKGVNIYRAEKKYTRGREREIFEMLENGCRISEGNLFEVLAAAF
jgi:phosphoserine aminotransferase